MTIRRVRCTWANFPGAPGVSTFYLSTSVTSMAPLATFFNEVLKHVPVNTAITVPNSGDEISESNGQISGTWTATGGLVQSSSAATQAFSGSSGAVVEWQSNALVNGRRPLGKTFIVPLIMADYDTNGSLSQASCITPLAAAANALLAAYSDGVKVWSRPYTPPADGKPHPPARVGSIGTAVSIRVPDLAVTMRSRRI